MKILVGFAVMIAALCFLDREVVAQGDHFAALGYLQNGAGMRMVGAGATFNVDVYVESYSSDDDAKRLANALKTGGNDALLKELEDMKDVGKIQLTGRVGFYNFK